MAESHITPGHRLYLIRLACGDGLRKPESQASFVERVERETGVVYDAGAISILERMEEGRRWLLSDAETFAKVDPQQRGPAWLAFGVMADEKWKPVMPKQEPPPAKKQEAEKRANGTTKKRRR